MQATWLLRVIGKGSKERFALVTESTVVALPEHRQDRKLDFDSGQASAEAMPLVTLTVVVPPTLAGRAKFDVTEAGPLNSY